MKIAVASGKGGTGKTTVSVLLYEYLDNYTYVDMDVEEPNGGIFVKPNIERREDFNKKVPDINENICTFCGKCADNCPYNALSIMEKAEKTLFFEDLCMSCGVCSYVCPVEDAIVEKNKKIGVINYGKGFKKSKEIDFIEGILDVGEPSGVPIINKINKKLDNDKKYILDAPPGTTCPTVATIEKVDYVVLVTEPTPFGINDLKLTLEVVEELKKPHGLVVNKDDRDNDLIEKFLQKHNIDMLGSIPYDEDFARSYSKGESLLNSSERIKNSVVEIIKNLRKTNKEL
ncbi:MAG: 4Fe-4S dicluster domain-containing protein [Candidatus Mcinerneyibacterium aminivorans]|jgi:MinD superfamily P-loop ATPase|uniref:4Fe-4S dicluster domain-containing protein n=1 Tax=Candidatus Mcinerneyibacterium aminivorans TaxID=2703815 RepID=A0A5D0MFX9_9BACT|nr:MAG: 4Fe-4S dicluster domain-containing protein [Candidatus Mcinerneyibacterium aminivorans]